MGKSILILISVLAINLIFFQNCGQDKSFTSNSNSGELNATSENLPPANVPPEQDTNANPLEIQDPVLVEEPNDLNDEMPENEPELIEGNVDRPDREVNFSQCTSYEEIPGDLFNLPDRGQSNGVCYYKKLLREIENKKSGSRGESRSTEVIADNHDGAGVIAPYILGDSSFKFSNLPGWKIALSGAFDDPKQEIAIDNFYLVDFKYGQNPVVQATSAFGTADAVPRVSPQAILYNGKPVAFNDYAPGGTAKVPAIELSPGSDASDFRGEFDLRLQALDCGGSAQGTDVYLVFH